MALEAIGNIDTVYGAAGDAIGLFGSIGDVLFPKPKESSLNNFRVFVGEIKGGDDGRSTDGHAPALAVWDGTGDFVGQNTPDQAGPTEQNIKDAGFRDYSIEGRQGVDYLSVVRTGNDGICIAMITGTESGTGRQFMWSGDIGMVCGAPWYEQAKKFNTETPAYIPACVWIDGNGDSGHIWKGFNLNLSSFLGTNTDPNDIDAVKNLTATAWTDQRDLLCASEPRFSMYEDIEIGNQIRTFKDQPASTEDDLPGSQAYRDKSMKPDNWGWSSRPAAGLLPPGINGRPKIICAPDGDCPPTGPSFNRNLPVQKPTRRSLNRRTDDHDTAIARIKKRQIIHADNLVVTNLAEHSARRVCNSPYSLGPDMVSTSDGLFCDMSEKQLWPVCSDPSSSYCFNMTSQTVRGSNTSSAPLWSNTTTSSGTNTPGGAVSLIGGSGASSNSHPVVPVKSYSNVATWDP